MKHFFAIVLVFLVFSSSAQIITPKIPSLNKSSIDLSYYPVNYRILQIQGKNNEPLITRVIYSRPLLNAVPEVYCSKTTNKRDFQLYSLVIRDIYYVVNL